MTIAVLETLTFGLGRMVAAAESAGERLCLLTGNRGIYRHELAHLGPDALDVVDIDTHDVTSCARVLKALPDLRGLINSTDTWLRPGAELATQFELPGPDPAAVRTLRDKRGVRVLLHERGLSRGTAVAVPADPAATGVVREVIGLPAVLKDSAGTGSRNVWLARDPEQLDAALAEAAGRRLLGRLVAEPFLAGPLFSAETLSWAGRTRLLGVTGRLMSPRWFGREDLLAFPVLLPDADLAALDDWVGRVLAAAGHTVLSAGSAVTIVAGAVLICLGEVVLFLKNDLEAIAASARSPRRRVRTTAPRGRNRRLRLRRPRWCRLRALDQADHAPFFGLAVAAQCALLPPLLLVTHRALRFTAVRRPENDNMVRTT
ncbi:MAG: ATP-grasp domain-containing protein [Pseudonocardiaceae bacterium]